jgi:hypothetical protein
LTAAVALSVAASAALAASDRSAPAAGVELGARAGACAPLWLTARATRAIDDAKAAADCEIERRLEKLSVLQARVDSNARLTDAHEAALDRILAATRSGLEALRAEIAGDTTIADVRADTKRIYEDYRVYALVARQVHLVVAADTAAATDAAFGDTAQELATAIDAAEAAGKDVTEARRHLAAMTGHVDAAGTSVDGIAAAVLPLTPAGWNAGTAKPILDEARSDLRAARTDLRAAVAEARLVLRELR